MSVVAQEVEALSQSIVDALRAETTRLKSRHDELSAELADVSRQLRHTRQALSLVDPEAAPSNGAKAKSSATTGKKPPTRPSASTLDRVFAVIADAKRPTPLRDVRLILRDLSESSIKNSIGFLRDDGRIEAVGKTGHANLYAPVPTT